MFLVAFESHSSLDLSMALCVCVYTHVGICMCTCVLGHVSLIPCDYCPQLGACPAPTVLCDGWPCAHTPLSVQD